MLGFAFFITPDDLSLTPSGSGRVDFLADDMQHLGMNPQVAGDDIAVLQVTLITLEVGGDTARLLHQERTGRDVPGLEIELPEAVIAPRGDVGEIQRRRAGTTNTRRLQHEGSEGGQVGIQIGKIPEGETGAEQGSVQVFTLGDAQAAIIEVGAAAAAGGEELVMHRVIHDGVLQAIEMADANGDAELRHAVDEVGGAIEGVDDPLEVLIGNAATFFGEDAVIRVGAVDDLDDGGLGALVDIGDEIIVRLAGDVDFIDPIEAAVDDIARFAGRANSGDENRMLHGNLVRG